MKRILKLSALVFLLGVVIISGCTKKTVLKEESTPKESLAAAPTKPAEVPPKIALKEDGKAKKRTEQVPPMEKEIGFKVQAPEEAKKVPAPGKAKESVKKTTPSEVAIAKGTEKAIAVKAPEKAMALSSKELYEIADIRFDFDKFNLNDEAREMLRKHAAWLSKNRDLIIVVEGHCDERGTAEYNLALGQRRADTTAKFLVDSGIDEKSIRTVSYGLERPLDPGHSEAAWAKNRRAHVNASGMGKNISTR